MDTKFDRRILLLNKIIIVFIVLGLAAFAFENIFKDNSDTEKNDKGERIFYLVLGQQKNAIFGHIERAQKFLGVDTNALDIEQLPDDISKDAIFMFSENQQQIIFDL